MHKPQADKVVRGGITVHGIRKCGQQMNLLTMFTKTAINLSVALCKGGVRYAKTKKRCKNS